MKFILGGVAQCEASGMVALGGANSREGCMAPFIPRATSICYADFSQRARFFYFSLKDAGIIRRPLLSYAHAQCFAEYTFV